MGAIKFMKAKKLFFYLCCVLLLSTTTEIGKGFGDRRYSPPLFRVDAPSDPKCVAEFLKARNNDSELAEWYDELPSEDAKTSVIRTWERLKLANVPLLYRQKLYELYDSNNNPRIVLSYGEQSDMLQASRKQNPYKDIIGDKIIETFDWQGEEITEYLGVIIDPKTGKLRFRFYHFISKGTEYKRGKNSPVNNFTTRSILPARLLDENPTELNPQEILLMQKNISNRTGDPGESFFVLKNVFDYLRGKLALSVFDNSPIRVWRNLDDGKVWTLDHRRLVFYKLAGINEVPVLWANQETILREAYKMSTSTTDAGKSCKINVWVNKPSGGNHRKFVDDRIVIIDDRNYEPWRFEEVSAGLYKVLDDKGNEISILNDIPKFIEE